METNKGYKIATFALLVVLFFLYHSYQKSQEENSRLSSKLYGYISALSEANDNIDQANSMIEDAQSYAWSDYEEMGYALENLSTVDTVYEPY